MKGMPAALSKDLHSSLIIADTHQDTIQRVVDLGHDLASETSAGYFDIPKMRQGNLSVVYFACCVDYRYIVAGTARQRLEQLLNAVKSLCERFPDDLQLVRTFGDIDRSGALQRDRRPEIHHLAEMGVPTAL